MTDVRPNLFVVGSMRAGTTSVFDWLGQHPDIHTSVPKEPHWFAFPDVAPRYAGPGDDQLNDRIVWEVDAYRELFRAGIDCFYRAEASAMYLHLPQALDRLLGDAEVSAPDSRYIVLLRDPADRARSAYEYNRMRGREPLDTLAEALDAEPERRSSGWSPMFWYEHASRVSPGLRRLLDRAGDRTRVLTRRDLRVEPTATAERLFAWLGLPVPAELDTAARNRSGSPRSATLGRVLAHGPLKRRLKPLVPRPVRRRLETLREENLRDPEIDTATMAVLRERLSRETQLLATLSGRPVSDLH